MDSTQHERISSCVYIIHIWYNYRIQPIYNIWYMYIVDTIDRYVVQKGNPKLGTSTELLGFNPSFMARRCAVRDPSSNKEIHVDSAKPPPTVRATMCFQMSPTCCHLKIDDMGVWKETVAKGNSLIFRLSFFRFYTRFRKLSWCQGV